MKQKRISKPNKSDRAWQKKVEEKVKTEKVELEHPKGKERFEQVIKQLAKKKKR